MVVISWLGWVVSSVLTLIINDIVKLSLSNIDKLTLNYSHRNDRNDDLVPQTCFDYWLTKILYLTFQI